MGRMEDSAHQENMLSAARAGKFTQADLEAACALAVAGALKGRELQVERATEVLRAERDQARRSVEYAVRLLTRIHSLLYPPRTTDNDGRVWEFKHPGDPHAILQELSDRIRALPDEVAKLDGPNVGGEARLAAHQPSHTTTATPQGVASTDQLGGRVRSEKD